MLLQAVLGRVADQAARVVHLVHDAVAGIDAGGAADALVLQAVADVDAGRTDLHAHAAVDAVAQALALRVDLLAARAARVTPLGVVADDQRVLVEHRALEARVRAHVLADLLAHEAGIAPGREGVEQHPEPFPRAEAERHRLGRQRVDGGEVADEGEAGPQREQHPHQMLGALAADLLGRPRAGVELHPLGAIALEAVLEPQEDLGVDRLRTGVAAPQSPTHRGEQEQPVGGDDQQSGQVDQVLRIQHQTEQVEAPADQIEQHRLAVVPHQPGQAVEDDLGEPHQGPAPLREIAADGARIDLLRLLVKRDGPGGCRLGSRRRTGGGRGHGGRGNGRSARLAGIHGLGFNPG